MKEIKHTEEEIREMYLQAHKDRLPFGIVDSANVLMAQLDEFVQNTIGDLHDEYEDEDELANEVETRLREYVAEENCIEIEPYANVDERWSEFWSGSTETFDRVVWNVYYASHGTPWRGHKGNNQTDAVNFMSWAVANYADRYDEFMAEFDREQEPIQQVAPIAKGAQVQPNNATPKEGVEQITAMAKNKNVSEWFTRYTEMELSNGFLPFSGNATYSTEGRYAKCVIWQVGGKVEMKINIDKAPHKMECSQWIDGFKYDWSGASKCKALWEIMTSRDATDEEMMAAMTPACAKRYAKAFIDQPQTKAIEQPKAEPAPAPVPSASPEGQPAPTAKSAEPQTTPRALGGLWWTNNRDDAFYAVPKADRADEPVEVRVYDMEKDDLDSLTQISHVEFEKCIEGQGYAKVQKLDVLKTTYPTVYADLLDNGFIVEVVKVEAVPAEPQATKTPEPKVEPKPTPDERAEQERIEREKAEAERQAKAEAERQAKEEAERIEREKAEAERKRKEREEAEKKAIREAAEQARKEREEAERKAKEEAERAEKERLAAEAKAKAEEEAAKRGGKLNPNRKTAEVRHPLFDTILKIVKMGENPYIWGAPGSGKTHMAEQLAKELGLEYAGNGCIYQPYELIGYCDANGVYHETSFVKSYRVGFFHLFDEFDRSIPSAIACVNSALANGFIDLPNGERLYKHPNFHLIAAGNTNGEGPTEDFQAANRLEASTLDRFVLVNMEYDEKVEMYLAEGDKEMVEFIHDLRRTAKECHYKMTLGYRAIIKLVKFMGEMTPSDAIKYAIVGSMSYDNLRSLTNNLRCGGRYKTIMQALVQEMRENERKVA